MLNYSFKPPTGRAKEPVLPILQALDRSKLKELLRVIHLTTHQQVTYCTCTHRDNMCTCSTYSMFFPLLSFSTDRLFSLFLQGFSAEVSFLAQCSLIIPRMQRFSSPLTLTEREVAFSLGIVPSGDALILVGNTTHDANTQDAVHRHIHLCM